METKGEPPACPPDVANGKSELREDHQDHLLVPERSGAANRNSAGSDAGTGKAGARGGRGAKYSVVPHKSTKLRKWYHAARRCAKPVMESMVFKTIVSVCLVVAIFGGAIWTLLSVPDDPGTLVLDIVMIIVTIIFIVDIFVNSVSEPKVYLFSFFFWMDIVGTVSMIFEMSFLMSQMRGNSRDVVLLRTARAAKVGARAGRFAKLLKWLSDLVRSKVQGKQAEVVDKQKETRKISNRLTVVLSTKVSMLTIGMVMIVPLFSIGQYPENDRSSEAWVATLEKTYQAALEELSADSTLESTDLFQRKVDGLVSFYSDMMYFPYKIEGFPPHTFVYNRTSLTIEGRAVRIMGGDSTFAEVPAKEASIITSELKIACRVTRPACSGNDKPAIKFNFASVKKLEAGIDILMVMFIISTMILMSYHLQMHVQYAVVVPIQRMFTTMKDKSAQILTLVKQHKENAEDEESSEDDGGEDGFGTEIEVLEKALVKIAKLVQITMQPNELTDEMMGMQSEAKGVLVEMMQLQRPDESPKRRVSHIQDGSALQLVVPELPVAVEVIESWNLDFLALKEEAQQQILLHLFFDSPFGLNTGRSFGDLDCFMHFHSLAKDGYSDQPYHCYTHACDVTHTVYRFLSLTQGHRWLQEVDQYALLISAVCHDIGHQGETNLFLVEVKHELALRYNDKSPLENMHCATLFDICKDKEADVFKNLSKPDYKRARKVCIGAILHTDNALHFETVKFLARTYELNKEVCEAQAKELGSGQLIPQYQKEVLEAEALSWLNLFLHMADISNPLKPFDTCQAWAWRVLDEFFAQGDNEKRLGIPVGMLNDRDKINRPGSQHGFINFLVAPFVECSVRIFPALHPLSTQMARNLRSWRDLWVADAKPDDELIAKRDEDIRKVDEKAEVLRLRCEG